MGKSQNLTGLVIGVILVAVGILSLFGRFFTFINWDNSWPLVVVGVGLLLFVIMAVGGKTYGRLAVPGSILVTVGLILLYMNITDRWEAWAYAWALIVCAIGAGTLINGFWSDQPDLRKRGMDTLRTGIILFLVFGVIMEFVFSLTGVSSLGNVLLWAVLLALVGLFMLITALLRLGKAGAERVDLFWPILMIGAGVVGILTNLNWLPKENLGMLANLWPLLLIVAGLGILFRGRSPWIGAGLGVLVLVVTFVVVYAGGQLGLPSVPFWLSEAWPIQIEGTSGERITGSGNVVTEDRAVSGVNSVHMEIPGNLEILQGTSQSLTVTGEDNILPLLITNVSGGRLTIRYRPVANVRVTRPLKLTLTVNILKELDVSSSSQVTVRPFTTGDFRLTLSSSGSINLEGIQADQITANLTSSGDILIKGSANQLDLDVSSSGSFQAGDLKAQNADVRLTSSGDVTVWVVDNLRANISSSGDIVYYGNPAVNKNLTSSGNLIPRGDK